MTSSFQILAGVQRSSLPASRLGSAVIAATPPSLPVLVPPPEGAISQRPGGAFRIGVVKNLDGSFTGQVYVVPRDPMIGGLTIAQRRELLDNVKADVLSGRVPRPDEVRAPGAAPPPGGVRPASSGRGPMSLQSRGYDIMDTVIGGMQTAGLSGGPANPSPTRHSPVVAPAVGKPLGRDASTALRVVTVENVTITASSSSFFGIRGADQTVTGPVSETFLAKAQTYFRGQLFPPKVMIAVEAQGIKPLRSGLSLVVTGESAIKISTLPNELDILRAIFVPDEGLQAILKTDNEAANHYGFDVIRHVPFQVAITGLGPYPAGTMPGVLQGPGTAKPLEGNVDPGGTSKPLPPVVVMQARDDVE